MCHEDVGAMLNNVTCIAEISMFVEELSLLV